MSKMELDKSLPFGLGADPMVCRVIPVSELDNATLLEAFALWNGLRGSTPYPSRHAVTPRILKPILRNTALVRVLDGGADYEYRIVGDAYVLAHGQSFQGKHWSETATMAPGFHKFTKPVYDRVVQSGEPLAVRGWVERAGAAVRHIYCQCLFLPLGETTGGVDHLLIVAVYLRSDGLEPAADTSGSFGI